MEIVGLGLLGEEDEAWEADKGAEAPFGFGSYLFLLDSAEFLISGIAFFMIFVVFRNFFDVIFCIFVFAVMSWLCL